VLFNLSFSVVTGADAKNANPFTGPDSDRVIVSVDTLAGSRVFSRLREEEVEPYDLVVFDEAHKLSVNRGTDLRVRPTDRYRLAEALAGVRGLDPTWRLPWSPHHLLLLTATPHQGKDYPYYGLWRLLEPDVLSTPEAFDQYPPQRRQAHFIRRTKEEMVHLSGKPLYPKRISDTLGYDLTQGEVSEQTLYDVALVRVIRQADPELPELATEEVLDCRLVGLKQFEGVELSLCPVEHLLLLRGGHGLPPAAQRLAAGAENLRDQAEAFLVERVARDLARDRRNLLLNTLPQREQFIVRGFNFQETELATARVKQSEKARGGNVGATKALKEIKLQQRSLAERRSLALATIRREPELIAPGTLNFVARALIVPSSDPEDLARHDANVERVAMEVARGYEEAEGAVVKDVHLPALARAAGLTDNPGFDLQAE